MASVFRINRPGTLRAQGAQAGDDFAEYMARLIHLIPAEVLAVYQAIYGILKSPTPSSFLPWLPIVGIALVLIVRIWGTRDQSNSFGTVQWRAVLVAVISFVIWVMTSGQSILGFVLPDLRIGSVLLVLWVFVVPYIYKGQ